MNSQIVFAPWSPTQVRLLNHYQQNPQYVPFTCPKHKDVALFAHFEGFLCPVAGCATTRQWAHAYMLTVGMVPGEAVNPIRNLLTRVHYERLRQIELWGEQHHPDIHNGPANLGKIADHWKSVNAGRVEDGSLSWDGILFEEVWEAMAAENPEDRVKELLEVAAVAIAWAEDIESRKENRK